MNNIRDKWSVPFSEMYYFEGDDPGICKEATIGDNLLYYVPINPILLMSIDPRDLKLDSITCNIPFSASTEITASIRENCYGQSRFSDYSRYECYHSPLSAGDRIQYQ